MQDSPVGGVLLVYAYIGRSAPTGALLRVAGWPTVRSCCWVPMLALDLVGRSATW